MFSALRFRSACALVILLAGLAPHARSEVVTPAIFGDHMVLQRDARVPVWGMAAPSEKITVSFARQTIETIAAKDGKWRVNLAAMPKNDRGEILKVAAANTLKFEDVVVGDVWVASGQSNMEYGILTDARGDEAVKTATDSQIRLFFVPFTAALEPQFNPAKTPPDSLNGKWQVVSPTVMAANWAWHGFSAAGYYFAREIRHATGAPVGMIGDYKGSTGAQAWVSIDGLKRDPILSHYLADHAALVEHYAQAKEEYPAKQADYTTAMKQWNAEYGRDLQAELANWDEAVRTAKAANQPPPPKPGPKHPMPATPPGPEGGFGKPANLFNGMVAPIIPYAIKGVIWYQGESNGDKIADAEEYETLFPCLIKDWRDKWGQGDFPFLYVQLANYRAVAKTPSEGIWPWVREAQLATLALPKTGMASAVDIGDPNNIHPAEKLDVGRRLALAARHLAYGENIVYSGPIFEASRIEANKIRLTFRQTGTGLTIGVPPWTPSGISVTPAARLAGFGIAGEDHKFVWADAVIEKASVVVSSPEVSVPLAVRYDWADSPQGNLYNKEGLPASPFRTEHWPIPKPEKP